MKYGFNHIYVCLESGLSSVFGRINFPLHKIVSKYRQLMQHHTVWIISSTLTVDFLEKSLHPSSQAYINLDTSSGRLTNHHSRTLHMVYPKISRAILVATL